MFLRLHTLLTEGLVTKAGGQRYRGLKRIFKLRGYLYLPPLMVMLFCAWNEYENDLIIWSLGLCFLGVGCLIRVWATKHIGKRIPRKYKERHKNHLVTTGPYRLVRNPLYVGNIVAMMGLCVLSELLWLMPIAFGYFSLLYSLVVRYEEHRLSALFGKEYAIYHEDVPRWIPRFSTIRKGNEADFTWFQSLRGELPGFASTSLMVFILLGKEIIGP